MRAVCEGCGAVQPHDWKAGDLCGACGQAVRRDVRCFWCAKWTPQGRFCRACGIKSFYIPRSNPDGVDVNARCLDAGTIASLVVEPFDGANWEANAATLAHLSDAGKTERKTGSESN